PGCAQAGTALPAGERGLIRLAWAADLPPPDELIEELSGGDEGGPGPGALPRGGYGGGARAALASVPLSHAPSPAPQALAAPEPARPQPQAFAALVAPARDHRDPGIQHALEADPTPGRSAVRRPEVPP